MFHFTMMNNGWKYKWDQEAIYTKRVDGKTCQIVTYKCAISGWFLYFKIDGRKVVTRHKNFNFDKTVIFRTIQRDFIDLFPLLFPTLHIVNDELPALVEDIKDIISRVPKRPERWEEDITPEEIALSEIRDRFQRLELL